EFDLCGCATAGDDRRPVVVRGKELEPHCLRAGPAGPAQTGMAFEGLLEPLVEQHSKRNVEPDHDRDGRREGGIEPLLLLPGLCPVEVVTRSTVAIHRAAV